MRPARVPRAFTAKLVGALAFSTGDPHALTGTQSLGTTLQAVRFR